MADWIRATRKNLCPICDHPDWCGWTDDGERVRCMRVPSNQESNGGWIHYLDKPMPVKAYQKRQKRYRNDVPALAASYKGARSLEPLGQILGLSARSLDRLDTGWDGRAWTFPMRDGRENIIGIRRRLPNGRKLTLKDTRNGLFIPSRLKTESVLYVCEGPTDCAALLDVGFDALGRPSCSTGVNELIEYLSRSKRRDVVIVADNDAPKKINNETRYPGQEGAQACANAIIKHVNRVCVITPRSKDVREWIRLGANKRSFEALVINSRWMYP